MFIKRNAPGAQGKSNNSNNYQHSNYNKKFPPYGRTLDEIRRKSLIPALRVIVSTDWKLGAAYPRIVITENANPQRLEFRYLAGLSVEIVHHEGESKLVSSLIDEILKVKPRTLALFNFDVARQQDPEYPATTLIHPAWEVPLNDL